MLSIVSCIHHSLASGGKEHIFPEFCGTGDGDVPTLLYRGEFDSGSTLDSWYLEIRI